MIMRIRSVISGGTGLPGLSTVYANGASTNPVTADASDMAARVRAFWFAIVASIPSGVSILVSPQVDVLDPATGSLVSGLSATPPAAVSTGSGTALPLASMALLVLNTGVIVNGRRLQGRSFIGPLNTSALISGNLNPANAAVITTAAGGMLTGSTSSVPVVWHRPKLPGPAGGSVSPVTSYVVRSPFAVLRSRRD